MTSVYDWSPTNASTNGTVDTTAGISIAEGATPPPNVNNGMRAMMLRTAQLRDDIGAVVVVGGSANALAITTSGTAYTTYTTGMYFRFIAAASNTTAATALVNAGTTKKIRKISGGTDVDLASGDILIGGYYDCVFKATADSAAGAWILVSPAELHASDLGVTVQGYDAATLKSNATAAISKGYTLTAANLGNIANFTIDPTLGNYQYGTNHAAATWTAPVSDCAVTILVTNDATAGTITFSGFTVSSSTGDALTTTSTNKFVISILRLNGVSTYLVKALQ